MLCGFPPIVVLLFVFLFLLGGSASPARAQSHCDRSVVVADGPIGYQDYGDRCEGYYKRPVGIAVGVLLVSLTWGTPAFGPQPIELTWNHGGVQDIRLHAQSLRPNLLTLQHKHFLSTSTLRRNKNSARCDNFQIERRP